MRHFNVNHIHVHGVIQGELVVGLYDAFHSGQEFFGS